MSIGYTVGKSYRIDTKYDRFAHLEVFKRLTQEAGKRGYGCCVSYSAMTRGYCCEIRKYQGKFRSQTSSHIYYFTQGHKYGPDPLTAVMLAMRECVPSDLLLSVLYLEAEAELLKIDYTDRVVLEKRLDAALDDLEDILNNIPAGIAGTDVNDITRYYADLVEEEWTQPLSAEPSDVAAAQYESMQRGLYDDIDDDL